MMANPLTQDDPMTQPLDADQIDLSEATSLLVDDNLQNLELMQAYLESLPCRILTARDGVEATQQIDAEQPDLVLLDVMMPRRNGFQVCRLFKSDAKTAEIPVILLTAKNQKEDRYWGQDCGADEYITKPFNTPMLEKVVERLLQRAEAGGEGPDAGEQPVVSIGHTTNGIVSRSTAVQGDDHFVTEADDLGRVIVQQKPRRQQGDLQPAILQQST